MNLEKVVFAFFIVLALTLNFGFFVGEIDNPDHHDAFELGAALAVSLIATTSCSFWRLVTDSMAISLSAMEMPTPPAR